MDFSLRQIVHFLAVLESSSFLKASERVNVTQPALSKSIRNLEDRLGVALFERLSRGLRPTQHGLAFERYARRILVDARRAVAEMEDVSTGFAGRVIIGIGTAYIEVVQDVFPMFRDRFPNARLEIVSGFAGHLGRLLAEGKVDIVFAMYNGIQQADYRNEFSFQHWSSDRFVGICPRGHPVENRINTPEELARYPWAMPMIEQAALSALRSGFTACRTRFPTVSITTDSIEMLLYAVTRQSMLSVVPEFIAASPGFENAGCFRIRDFDFQRNIGLIRRRDFDLSPVHDYFLALMREQFVATSIARRAELSMRP